MKTIAMAMILIGAGGLAWTVIDRLSTDAIGMAIGMALGVLSGVPAAALVLLALRRNNEDGGEYYEPPVIDQYPPAQPYSYNPAPPPVVIVCREDVTPYYNGMRRLLGNPPLPKRADAEPAPLTPEQIAEMEAYLAHLKTLGEVRQVDPRQYVVRWNGEENR